MCEKRTPQHHPVPGAHLLHAPQLDNKAACGTFCSHLFSTSGPLTILGSLPFSILPIWRAISVLPVPAAEHSACELRSPAVCATSSEALLHSKAHHTPHLLLPPTWRAVQQHAAHVADAQPLHHAGREDAGGKGTAEDLLKLVVQAADAQLLKVELFVLEQLQGGCRRVSGMQLDNQQPSKSGAAGQVACCTINRPTRESWHAAQQLAHLRGHHRRLLPHDFDAAVVLRLKRVRTIGHQQAALRAQLLRIEVCHHDAIHCEQVVGALGSERTQKSTQRSTQ